MTIQGLEEVMALEAHHLPNLEEAYKRVLILECAGREQEDIAQTEHVSAGTVGQWLRIASSEIALCLPAGGRVGKAIP